MVRYKKNFRKETLFFKRNPFPMNHSIQSPFLLALAVTGWIAAVSFFFPNSVVGNFFIFLYVIFLSIGFWKQKKSLTEKLTGDGVVRSVILSLVIPTCLWFFHLVQLDILGVFFLPAIGGLLATIKKGGVPGWLRLVTLLSIGTVTFFLSFPDRIFYNPVFPERTLAFFVILLGCWIYAWHKHSRTQAHQEQQTGLRAEDLLSNFMVLWFVFLIQSPLPLALSSNAIALATGVCAVLFLGAVFFKRPSPRVSDSSLHQRKNTETFAEVLPLLLSLGLWTFSGGNTVLPLLLGIVIISLQLVIFFSKNKGISKQN